jgi:hypothetical protein
MNLIERANDALEVATPGPWEWVNQGHNDECSEWSLGPGVLLVDGSDGTPEGDEIDRANARLIALSPDLARLASAAGELAELMDEGDCPWREGTALYDEWWQLRSDALARFRAIAEGRE